MCSHLVYIILYDNEELSYYLLIDHLEVIGPCLPAAPCRLYTGLGCIVSQSVSRY